MVYMTGSSKMNRMPCDFLSKNRCHKWALRRSEVQEIKVQNTYMNLGINQTNETRKFLYKSISRPEYKIDRIIGVGKLTSSSCKASIIKMFVL